MQMLTSGGFRRTQVVVALVVFALGAALLIAAGKPAQAANGVSIVVNTTADAAAVATHCGHPVVTCSLRDAITLADTDTNDIVHVPAIPSGTATVYPTTSGGGNTLPVSASMTIAGDDPRLVAVDGGTTNPVFATGNGNNPPTITITGITIQNGHAATGGGIVNSNASLNLANDIVANNVATGINAGGQGGGIFSSVGLINIQSTTFSNNVTNEVQNTVARGAVAPRALSGFGQGGGIYNSAGTASSQLTLTNDTFNGNSSGQGGAVWTAAPTTLNNDTIVGNSAVNPPGNVPTAGGGGVYANAITVNLHNTIVAKNLNSSGDCGPNPAGFSSAGHNIDSDNTCNLIGTGDQKSTDPQVAALAFNAPPVVPPNGFPNTMAITNTSPAFDKADNTNCPTADERGLSRPQGAACDVGAFEVLVVAPTLPKSGVLAGNSNAPQPAWLGLALLLTGALGAAALIGRRV